VSIHHKLVIVGGGTGGISTAALLRRAGETDIAIIEPSRRHFYQPLWTLVGGGVFPREFSARDEARYIPPGARWINQAVAAIAPDRRYIETDSGLRVGYDFLVLATGIRPNLDAIPGMREALATDCVSTNYSYDLAPKTWNIIRSFRGGVALFHMPGTPIKCPGAPQKIMYLAADYFRRRKIADATNVIYGSAPGAIYGIKEYAAVLNDVIGRYHIDARYGHDLIEIRPDRREAVFAVKGDSQDRRVTIVYDMLHVAAPQQTPDFIRQSALADPQGWVKVDKHTMRNPDYPNVFAIGDAAGTPNSKTGASACKQAPVVAANVLASIRGMEPAARYDGYVACPIITGYGRMLLCEFDYSGTPTPTIPLIDTFKERYDMWLLKKYGLPWLYWNLIVRGRTVPFIHTEPHIAQVASEAAA
jgi:sulfide:quinone oxidoreductase